MSKQNNFPAGTESVGNTDKLCTPKSCGDCDYYKYYSLCGLGCHLTPDTGIIREGPITKDCIHKVKISKAEQRKRSRRYKMIMKEYAIG